VRAKRDITAWKIIKEQGTTAKERTAALQNGVLALALSKSPSRRFWHVRSISGYGVISEMPVVRILIVVL
jgi:hypothetical protein